MKTAAETVRIGLLGPLAVTDAAGRAVPVGGQRVRALLILLALDAGRAVPAHSLIERIWPDGRPAGAANALQSLVSRLRAALRQAGCGDGLVESSPAGYRLAVPPEAVDALAFEVSARAGSRALAEGDAPAAARLLHEALAAWRGAALADVAGEEFAFAPAVRFEELRGAALLDRIEADLVLGQATAVTGELRELAMADPLAERPVALLMRALAATGRQAEALGVYAKARETLAGRLGVDPSPQLERVQLAILRQEAMEGAGGQDAATAGQRPGSGPLAAVDTAAVDTAAVDTAAVDTAAGPRPPGGARPAGFRQPTSFVGRDGDVACVHKRLAAERLVTLTGPGGVGKTRLAAEVAARLAVPAWLAELAPVTDPAEVALAVLDALGLRERSISRRAAEPAGGPLDRLAAALADRDALVVLDNCEHVIDAAAGLAARLLADCPRVRVLATSREPLRIPGETLYVVSPLPVPPVPAAASSRGPVSSAQSAFSAQSVSSAQPVSSARPAFSGQPVSSAQSAFSGQPAPGSGIPGSKNEADIPEISAYPAVRLFADRAAAVLPGFSLGPANAGDVARICQALDGMPLAIELAAPWLRTLTPAQLAERLDDRFALLTGGSRTALPRHQTLRAVVGWSWNLLSEAERTLARRLAVFPGGATLAAAERVCADAQAAGQAGGQAGGQPVSADGTSAADGQAGDSGTLPRAAVLPALAGLVGKSILTAAGTHGGDLRYRMLETVRAYGLERLAEAGEETEVRDALAAYCLDLAEVADPLLRTAGQARWFRRLAAEQDNANAALRWAIRRGDTETALRLIRALGYFWVQRGHGEEDALAREVLAMPAPPRASQRIAEARIVCALLAAGGSWEIGAVREQLTAAIAELAAWGVDLESSHPLACLAEPLLQQYDGEHERARAQYERFAAARDPWLRAMGRLYRVSYAAALGQLDGVEAECLATLGEFRALGEQWGIALTLTQLAEFTELRADHAASIAALEEARALSRELGGWGDLAYTEARLALIRARTGDSARARTELDQVERAVAEIGRHIDTSRWITFMRAELAWREGDLPGVARCCAELLASIEDDTAAWWQSLRAQVMARLAMAVLRQGDAGRCHELLAGALRAAVAWVEHQALAAVLDACAAYALGRDRDGAGATAGAGAAARLLGAAHAVRGAFDESSLDAPPARSAARKALGPAVFDAAYRSARHLGYEAALSLACEICWPGHDHEKLLQREGSRPL